MTCHVLQVQQNGEVHSYQFNKDYRWSFLSQFKLCTAKDAEIISICLHKGHNAFYWCEHRSDKMYTICRLFLPDSNFFYYCISVNLCMSKWGQAHVFMLYFYCCIIFIFNYLIKFF